MEAKFQYFFTGIHNLSDLSLKGTVFLSTESDVSISKLTLDLKCLNSKSKFDTMKTPKLSVNLLNSNITKFEKENEDNVNSSLQADSASSADKINEKDKQKLKKKNPVIKKILMNLKKKKIVAKSNEEGILLFGKSRFLFDFKFDLVEYKDLKNYYNGPYKYLVLILHINDMDEIHSELIKIFPVINSIQLLPKILSKSDHTVFPVLDNGILFKSTPDINSNADKLKYEIKIENKIFIFGEDFLLKFRLIPSKSEKIKSISIQLIEMQTSMEKEYLENGSKNFDVAGSHLNLKQQPAIKFKVILEKTLTEQFNGHFWQEQQVHLQIPEFESDESNSPTPTGSWGSVLPSTQQSMSNNAEFYNFKHQIKLEITVESRTVEKLKKFKTVNLNENIFIFGLNKFHLNFLLDTYPILVLKNLKFSNHNLSTEFLERFKIVNNKLIFDFIKNVDKSLNTSDTLEAAFRCENNDLLNLYPAAFNSKSASFEDNTSTISLTNSNNERNDETTFTTNSYNYQQQNAINVVSNNLVFREVVNSNIHRSIDNNTGGNTIFNSNEEKYQILLNSFNNERDPENNITDALVPLVSFNDNLPEYQREPSEKFVMEESDEKTV
ncbi:hypothetical protein HDU92_005816 [Lobulomyces angularis]|nr:hypothetical protein HDU92_005816 [Lobulomyces angularis]